MNGMVSAALRASLVLGLTSLSSCAWADPSPLIQQPTLGSDSGSLPGLSTPETASEPIRAYPVPLHYTTPAFILSELDAALMPEEGPTVLQRGETVHCPFRILGLRAIIPNPRGLEFLILSTPDGFVRTRDLIMNLDVPAKHASKAPLKGQSRKRQSDGAARSVCDIIPSVAATPSDVAASGGWVPYNGEKHAYRLPLSYTTPDQILAGLNGAYVPDDGAVVLGPGKVLHNAFRMDGVEVIIPSRQDDSLLVEATPDVFSAMKNLLSYLDAPAGNGQVREPPVKPTPRTEK